MPWQTHILTVNLFVILHSWQLEAYMGPRDAQINGWVTTTTYDVTTYMHNKRLHL